MNVHSPHPMGVPGYRLIRWVGASGAATVYAAEDLSRRRLAAVKIFRRIDADRLARLEQLLQADARLLHPNIVRILDIGRTTDDRLFHSMPLLLGFEGSRHDLLERPPRVIALLRDLLEGLGHAHRCGMVHGDIKPSNVLFDQQGHARLADFGIAGGVAGSDPLGHAVTDYLSPEQARGELPDPSSDIYGIGMLACELLAGVPPGLRPTHMIAAGTAHEGQPLVPRLPPETHAWQGWIERALAPSPEQRFQDARAMADAMRGLAIHPRRSRAGGTVQRWRVPRKWKLPAAILAVVILALAAAVMWEPQSQPATGAAFASGPATVASPALPTTAALATTVALPAAATIGNPASPTTVALPAAALTTAADTTSSPVERAQALTSSGDILRAQGHLFSPPFRNAASDYLAALAFDPGNPAATAGIDAMLATLRSRLDKAWKDNRGTREAVGLLQQGDALAPHADALGRRDWRDFRSRLAQQVGNAITRAASAHDPGAIAALEPLAKALPAKLPAGVNLAAAQFAANTPTASAPTESGRMRDPHGPLLVYVPAGGGLPAFAIERVEVTRADYAAFASATHRPPAKCVEAHNPFSRLRHLTWQAPGFVQGGNHPVVCVSWNDAVAYAAWLSKATGETYLLPSGGEWLRAAQGMPKEAPCKLGNVDDVSRHDPLDDDRWSCSDGAAETAPVGHYAPSGVGAYDMYGNVSEWLAGGSAHSRAFRGLSWRDGQHRTPLGSEGTADSDVGYTSVGFRVVRVIDGAHPAPPPTSGH